MLNDHITVSTMHLNYMGFHWHCYQLHILLYKLIFLKVILFLMPIMASLCAFPHSLSYLPDPVCLSGPPAGCALVVTISITAMH